MYNETGVLIAMVNMLLPYVIFPVLSALLAIPPEMRQASASLGAGALRTFWRVTLPLSLPGVAAGGLLVFIVALGFFITPALLGGPKQMMISNLIEFSVRQVLNWPFAFALANTLLMRDTAPLLRLRASPRADGFRGPGSRRCVRAPAAVSGAWPRGPHSRCSAARAAFLAVPVVSVIPMSFSSSMVFELIPREPSLSQYRRFFSSPDWMAALGRSFQVALGTTAIATVMGTLAALGLPPHPRSASRPARGTADRPRIVPSIVFAVALYFVFSQAGLVGTMSGLVLAHSVLAFPFVVVLVGSALEGLDPALEEASRSLGGGPAAHVLPGHVSPDPPRGARERPLLVQCVLRRGGGHPVHQRGAEQDAARQGLGRHPLRDHADPARDLAVIIVASVLLLTPLLLARRSS